MSVVFSTVERSRWYEAYTTFEREFTEAFAAMPQDWPDVAQVKPIQTLRAVISWFDTDAGFVEDTGAVPSFNLAERELDPIQVKDYILPWAWTRNQIRDDTTGTIDRAMSAAMSAAEYWSQTMHTLVFNILVNSETTPCWNGQFLVDTAHPVHTDRVDLGTQDNLVSGAALSGTSLNSAFVRARRWKLPNGKPRPMPPGKPTLWVPPELRRTAMQLATDEYYTPNATQGIANTTGPSPNDLRGTFIPRESQYLTGTGTAFLVFPMVSGRKPVIVVDRLQPEMHELGPGSEYYELEKKAKIWHEARVEAVAGYPETIFAIRA